MRIIWARGFLEFDGLARELHLDEFINRSRELTVTDNSLFVRLISCSPIQKSSLKLITASGK